MVFKRKSANFLIFVLLFIVHNTIISQSSFFIKPLILGNRVFFSDNNLVQLTGDESFNEYFALEEKQFGDGFLTPSFGLALGYSFDRKHNFEIGYNLIWLNSNSNLFFRDCSKPERYEMDFNKTPVKLTSKTAANVLSFKYSRTTNSKYERKSFILQPNFSFYLGLVAPTTCFLKKDCGYYENVMINDYADCALNNFSTMSYVRLKHSISLGLGYDLDLVLREKHLITIGFNLNFLSTKNFISHYEIAVQNSETHQRYEFQSKRRLLLFNVLITKPLYF